ncbi:MAG: fasciclin domain-containing protein [Planctomycetes bacterium]|nr:fasciclin domain-containing protein [Planctomycetota bacterium]
MKSARSLSIAFIALISLGVIQGSAFAARPFAALALTWVKSDDSPKNIVETAASVGQFKTLIAAAQAAGLADTLQSPGPFTVFAPTDEAFSKLPEGTVESLLKAENRDKLAAILKYHVVPGNISLSKALEAGTGKTVLGPSLSIKFVDGRVQIGTASLVTANVAASNGTIHVIDSVLLPPAAAPTPSAAKARDLIELAIERGVPLFNDGHHDACKAIYEVTAHALLNMPATVLKPESRDKLTSALTSIEGDSSARVEAWSLRRALDAVDADLAAAE